MNYIENWLDKCVFVTYKSYNKGITSDHSILISVDSLGIVVRKVIQRQATLAFVKTRPASENWELKEYPEKLCQYVFIPFSSLFYLSLEDGWRDEYIK